ncbi:MAG: hypothetical protein HY265_01880 [Deltaproteobacteria bacterium]|nr:hypothetical protein [Deltaproteobacteria bacterium]
MQKTITNYELRITNLKSKIVNLKSQILLLLTVYCSLSSTVVLPQKNPSCLMSRLRRLNITRGALMQFLQGIMTGQ